MEDREEHPKWNDTTELPGGGTLGGFWHQCKSWRKCGKPPYSLLLDNRVLRADYRVTKHHERAAAKPKRKMVSPEIKIHTVRM